VKNRNIMVLLFLFWMSAITAPAQARDVQKLKTKPQQLEQLTQDLQKQITTVKANEDVPQPSSSAKAVQPANVLPASMRRTSIRHYSASSGYRESEPLSNLVASSKTDLVMDANRAGSYRRGFVPSWCGSISQPLSVNGGAE
jgi:hypothetical protein